MKKIIFIILLAGLGVYFTMSFLNTKKAIDNDDIHSTETSQPASTEAKKVAQPSGTSLPSKNAASSMATGHEDHDHGNNDEGFEVEEVEIPNDEEGASLIEISEIAAKFSTENVNVEALKDALTKSGLEVDSTKSTNPYTGSLTIIRTKNSLPGTRYFHAQVFSDEKGGNPFVQHISYEYRPSKNAFAEAVAATKKVFGLKKQADVRKDGYYSWSTDDGYLIWIKRQDKEDIKDDAFNAKTEEDVGSVRVTKELEIH